MALTSVYYEWGGNWISIRDSTSPIIIRLSQHDKWLSIMSTFRSDYSLPLPTFYLLDGDDTVVSSEGADVFAGRGNDLIITGSDSIPETKHLHTGTYHGNRGDDLIVDYYGSSVVYAGRDDDRWTNMNFSTHVYAPHEDDWDIDVVRLNQGDDTLDFMALSEVRQVVAHGGAGIDLLRVIAPGHSDLFGGGHTFGYASTRQRHLAGDRF